MKRHIYRIEIQKSTGTISFLKSYSTYFKVDGTEINETHRSATKLFDDRTEVYSFLRTIDVPEETLIHEYYKLAREFKTSLEYEEGEWTYLIPKRHPKRPYRMAHRNPVLPSYKTETPIKFYKTKKKEDEEEEKRNEEKKEFYSSYWYSYFFRMLGMLTAREGNCSSSLRKLLKAFTTTLNHYYLEVFPSQIESERFFYLTTINESCYFTTIEKFYCAGAQTFNTYIKPYMAAPIMINEQFFSVLPDYLLVNCFTEFYAAAYEWERRHNGRPEED